tara:strand:- start:381 stop:584 length:204 start_codon:yes stop_codon:yes gene_type:complete
MFAGCRMDTRYDIGETIYGGQINEASDYRITKIEIDDDGQVTYRLNEICPIFHEDVIDCDERDIIDE